MEAYYYGNIQAKKVLIVPLDAHDLALAEQLSSQDFLLIAVKVDNWNNDLSPWAASPVYGTQGFGGGAKRTLSFLEANVLVPLQKDGTNRELYIGGYSLAGLFALWAAYETDCFKGVAAVSASVWFPRFAAFTMQHTIRTSAVYLSLGDKEEKTRNPVMAQVGDAIRNIYAHLHESGVPCVLEWNQGNHFKEPALRLAKGIEWVMK